MQVYFHGSLPSRGAWIEIWKSWPEHRRAHSRSPHGERGLKSYCGVNVKKIKSRSPHGERGLKCEIRGFASFLACRSPHGERGLKFIGGDGDPMAQLKSLPSRGAWIEMGHAGGHGGGRGLSLPSRGAWIEMTLRPRVMSRMICRSPHGERGLKFFGHRSRPGGQSSLPSRGAWIEIAPL